jgi:RNA polymerase sigma-70 factor (ECF subfamily)
MAVITHYYRELLNFCRRKVRDPDTAADLVQESYLRVLVIERGGQAIIEPVALLKKVAVHLKIDMDRRADIRRHEDIDGLAEADMPASPEYLQPEQVYSSSQAAQAYMKTIEQLPERCREAFSMYVFDDLSNKEIAARMGISLSMVNQYIGRGKLACAACRAAFEETR